MLAPASPLTRKYSRSSRARPISSRIISRKYRAQTGRTGGRLTSCLSRSRLRRAAGRAGTVSTTTAATAAAALRPKMRGGREPAPSVAPCNARASGPTRSSNSNMAWAMNGPASRPIAPRAPIVRACIPINWATLPPRLAIDAHSVLCCSSTRATVVTRW